MTPTTLADWLAYQQRIHPRDIELGLERVRAVWQRLGAPRPAPLTITVGGTNGKGSTVALLDAMLRAGGRRVGCYTSPHILDYNERVRVDGVPAGDAVLIDAFTRIEAARGEIALTYFEFGTLAALLTFAAAGVDVALLEVGLGGRLDAVNILDADAAIVTTVDLDHQDWLGADLDSIGREKAGIFRPGRPAILGMTAPPAGLLDAAAQAGVTLLRAGRDFSTEDRAGGWRWRSGGEVLDLPPLTLAAPCQRDNAAAALMALFALRDRLGWDPAALADGVRNARIAARLQRFVRPGAPELVLDVGHNPQAARALAAWLATQPLRRTQAVFGALGDKDAAGIVAPLAGAIARWHLAGLDRDSPRGLDAAALRVRVAQLPESAVATHADVAAALDAALAGAAAEDRVLAFGSFFVAAATLNWLQRAGYSAAERAR